METFRIEVGKSHKVQAGNIVGAIANEARIGSDAIGKITIFDQYSTVDLPVGMPQRVFRLLENVRVAGRKLRISRMAVAGPRPAYASKARPKHRKAVAGGRPR